MWVNSGLVCRWRLIGQYWELVLTSHILIYSHIHIHIHTNIYTNTTPLWQHHAVIATALHHNIAPEILEVYHTFSYWQFYSCQATILSLSPSTWAQIHSFPRAEPPVNIWCIWSEFPIQRDSPGAVCRCTQTVPSSCADQGRRNKGYWDTFVFCAACVAVLLDCINYSVIIPGVWPVLVFIISPAECLLLPKYCQ